MHDHFDKSDGGDADVFEVVGIFLPWPLGRDFLVLLGVEGVEGVAGGVDQLDRILDLCEPCQYTLIEIDEVLYSYPTIFGRPYLRNGG